MSAQSNFEKMVSLGPFDLNFSLILTEQDAEKFKIPKISEIKTITDLKEFLIIIHLKN